jgi:mannose-6-phosphate isomerase-like protein (cupin superfamily)
MKFGDEIVEVTAGECVTIPPGIEHRLWNTSDSEPLVLLCCCAPGYSHEDTVVT